MRYCILLIVFIAFSAVQVNAQGLSINSTDPLDPEMNVYASPKHLYAAGGFFHLGSDISRPSFTGWSVALGYQDYLSNLKTPFFLRVGAIYGQDQNIDVQRIGQGSGGFNQTLEDLGYSQFIRNYSTTIVGVQARIGYDFVSLLLNGSTNRLGIYVLAGPDVVYYSPSYDALNANGNRYDFSELNLEGDNAKEEVAELLDGNYETEAPVGRSIDIGFGAGLGIQYHFSKGFGLGLEHQFGLSFTDKLDGYISSDNNDNMNHTRLFIFFSLWEPSPGT